MNLTFTTMFFPILPRFAHLHFFHVSRKAQFIIGLCRGNEYIPTYIQLRFQNMGPFIGMLYCLIWYSPPTKFGLQYHHKGAWFGIFNLPKKNNNNNAIFIFNFLVLKILSLFSFNFLTIISIVLRKHFNF